MSKFNEIIADEKPTLVDVYATWCGPCKAMAPQFEQAKETLGDAVTALKIDMDKNPAFASRYGIRSVPTLMLFKNGKVVWQQSGVIPANELVAQSKNFM
ncbi:thioredoxin [Pricia sp. S334]|uniref:Thioredoxin n=1 Tax=Pricia mediterranea TaxID=3076079 RepID=A0ABU3L0Z4_9FLAO|nr:thioredoxin [Pricia sp. S334]MDT7827377.1 thioredoxin [Pricia sp. S334]